MQDCKTCRGCGKVADTDQREPWSDWMALPLQNAAAVLMGIVRPMPCPTCDGSGKAGLHCATCRCEVDG